MKGIRIIFQVVDGDEAVSVQSSRIVPIEQLPDCSSLEAIAMKYANRFWDTVAAVCGEFIVSAPAELAEKPAS